MTAITVSTAIAAGRGELANVRRRSLLTAQFRALWVVGGFVALAVLALGRLAFLGIAQPALAADSLTDALLPPRGDIVDRNGVPLARAFPGIALWFDPKAMGEGAPLVRSPREVAEALARIFPDMDVAQLTARLASGEPGYLRRRILPEEANRIRDIGEPALEFPRETERFYPQGAMAAHVLGYVAADGHGRVGMEQVFDQQLTGATTRGAPAVLSLDTRVQGALEDELSKGMELSQAKGAAGIVLDVDTGEVIALASLPTFNPNLIDQGGAGNIFNRFTNQVYELGSVMKPITVAAAIDYGVVTDMAKRYPAGPLRIDGFEIHDHENYGGSLNVPEALIHSSNIVSAEVGAQVGAERLRATMMSLGFNQRPYIELPAKGFPLWPKGDWSKITTMTVSFGHGMAVTPLHLACAYAAMVNGGLWRPATLEKVAPGAAAPGRRVWQASTSARMRQLLRLIVDDGTGRKANAAGFRVGGKTGSAEKPGNGGYQKTSIVATFAAAFPMDHPRYVVIAMLDEPQGTVATSGQRTAAWNAAPVVGRLVPRIGPLLGIMPDANRDIDITDLAPLVGSGKGVKLGALAAAAGIALPGGAESNVTGFAIDHRKVAPDNVFGAFRGAERNGEDFIPAAVTSGAVAVVAAPEARIDGAIHIADPVPRRAFARLAAQFFTPVPETIVAVTGTNGKTSTVEMTRQLWRMAGERAASIGTLGVTTPDESVSTGLTTPDIVTFLANMTGLAREGVTHVAYEASSHGLSQYRNEGLRVAAGAFTNLSRDHLDYHAGMEQYFAAKMRLFDEVVADDGTAVIWADDGEWSARAGEHAELRGLRLLTVGEGADASGIRLLARSPGQLGQGLELECRGVAKKVNLPLIGAYQAANALVSAGLVIATGGEPMATLDALARLQPVRGRLERAAISRAGAPVYVDYAHTPDALEAAIAALRPHVAGRLIVVFGAGGDRDPGKRIEMGRVVTGRADAAIVTDDNPRGEDPAVIRRMVLDGAPGAREVGDRRAAIAEAIGIAGRDDIVLIAGKGHEQGQIVGAGEDMRVLPFDDVNVARECAA